MKESALGRLWFYAKRAKAKLVIVFFRQPALWLAYFLSGLGLRVYLLAHSTYQPIRIGGKLLCMRDAGRETEKRWEIIRRHIPANCRTAVDLGSGEGFFSFNLAELNITTIGIDNFRPALFVAQQKCIADEPKGVGFICQDITHELVQEMPSVDIVLCLSVTHHLMHFKGLDWCAQLLRILRTKINQAMFFEMGQSDEYVERQSRDLPDMGSDPQNWIRDFIQEQGFSKVEKIGSTLVDSYKDQTKERAIFMVWP